MSAGSTPAALMLAEQLAGRRQQVVARPGLDQGQAAGRVDQEGVDGRAAGRAEAVGQDLASLLLRRCCAARRASRRDSRR